MPPTTAVAVDNNNNLDENSSVVRAMSDYERTRAENIVRNNAKLRALGLISEREEVVSNATAWGRQLVTIEKENDDNDDELSESEYVPYNDNDDESSPPSSRKRGDSHRRGTKRARTNQATVGARPTRTSLRLSGQGPELRVDTTTGDSTTEAWLSSQPAARRLTGAALLEARRQRREECREARQRAALHHASLGLEAAAQKNPTATYEHCLHRVHTLTHKQLANRIRTIERAAGQHCVVKMAIMASCLHDEGLYELSGVANEALERLKGLKPPPSPTAKGC